MNSLLLIAVCFVGTVVVAQDSTGNPAYDVQYAAQAIHKMYETSFDNIRFYSSDVLNEQNNELLDTALEIISSWSTAAASDLPETPSQILPDVPAPVPVANRLAKTIDSLNSAPLGEASRWCIDIARKTLQERQEAILREIESYRYKSLELQKIAIGGLRDFNILLDFDQYYDRMTPIVSDYYLYLMGTIYPALEIKVGDLEYNRQILTLSMTACLEDAVERYP